MTFAELLALKPSITKTLAGDLPKEPAITLYETCLRWEQFRVNGLLDLGQAAGDYTIAHAAIRSGTTFDVARASYVAAFPSVTFPVRTFPW